MEEKKELRKLIKKTLSELTLPLYEDLSYQIAHRLYEDVSWKSASTIGITISKSPEVDTFQLIRKAWEQGKRIVVPKCEANSRSLNFRELTRFSQLETVYFGLYEPVVGETKSVDPVEIDLIVVPGLAFSKNGYRLGFGGGYYDRFLQNYQGNTLSLAFQKQLIPDLPIETHDIAVGKIITEAEVIFCGD
ncbi:MAG TPA: 5-formyltetrahydrofolate cyclo-ligase [Bacillus bacterium]|nr:5-formyltetrahydrofolate cyclo-ligase [Bacillus sp. (in: firmicutes)]